MALDILMKRAEHELDSQGITQIHAFVQDTKFYNLLQNKYGFQSTKGKALVKVVG